MANDFLFSDTDLKENGNQEEGQEGQENEEDDGGDSQNQSEAGGPNAKFGDLLDKDEESGEENFGDEGEVLIHGSQNPDGEKEKEEEEGSGFQEQAPNMDGYNSDGEEEIEVRHRQNMANMN